MKLNEESFTLTGKVNLEKKEKRENFFLYQFVVPRNGKVSVFVTVPERVRTPAGRRSG
jgi:hypothetical protein